MNKALLPFLLIICLASCKKKERKIENIDLVRQFYKTLNDSDFSKFHSIIADSILTKEIDYEKTFSKRGYIELMKWDSIFEPQYEIIEIKLENEIVKTKISKIDKRLIFLHEKPVITNEEIKLKNKQISSIEIISYADFNDSIFSKNRRKLLKWVKKNKPELKGFLHDQTKKGGLKYLKAIELYNNVN